MHMITQRAFRIAAAISLALALLQGPPAVAKTTDQSDVFWLHTESGWGVQLVQNDTAIFATLYVYGPDGQPVWYTALLTYQGLGSFTWSGKLYKSTGPWFGTTPFDPDTVTRTEVGSMSVNFPLINQGTLIYSVDGVQVTKTVERFLIAYEQFGGTYVGVTSQQGTGLACNPARNTNSTPANVQITQATPAMTVMVTSNLDTCTFTGTYTQAGHMGHLGGNYSCTSGDIGTFTFLEMNRTFSDFRARTNVVSQSGCTLKGYLLGLVQPPPPQ
jgi:hypothetical protein